ncbi:peptide-methionine (S)-S-oxide reductase MsrA [Erythrobacter litoralis]|uniref:Peptide methionine sulfoxide reductase MsrA n=1 Tax=Erythrobacter litoralis (strain HTCC2594) TaxID=314225 RepID=Q2N6U3_ERYLH|nr:peptide-methionine (S)-S-oxide reductase MsrA [Erythrobacter litoralis]ABC64598.1 peptide methionine sulfoxide reductase [Erythrobacter litoralis HTCC2594]
MKRGFPLFAAVGLALAGCGQVALAKENHVRAPAPKVTAAEKGSTQTAIFAGGCFWGIEAIFSHVKGVESAISGYHGGTARSAKYSIVTSGVTDHAESVKVVYDPRVVSYDELVRIFFSVGADPTLRNRQGPDVGAHYRAALIPVNAQQRKVAAAYLRQMERSDVWSKPIMTKIESYKAFYPAETYHQDFMAKNPNHGYIRRWDAPKVRALKQFYPEHFRASFKRG